MSRHGTLLPIPERDPIFAELIALWPQPILWPTRSVWLTAFESMLRVHYPQSSSADRKLTARHYAPFPLALGPDVP